MGRHSDQVELAVLFKAETDKAVLVYDYASEEEIWLPLSGILEMHRPASHVGDGTIVLEGWLAKAKGLG